MFDKEIVTITSFVVSEVIPNSSHITAFAD